MLKDTERIILANELTKRLMIRFKMKTEFENTKSFNQDQLNYRALSKMFAIYIQAYSHNYISLSEIFGGTAEDMKFLLKNLHCDFNKNTLTACFKRLAISDPTFNDSEMGQVLKKVLE